MGFTELRAAAQQALEALEADNSKLWPSEKRTTAITALKAALPEPVLQTCNCRWDGEVQVQQCTLHEAHVDAIHEWAERAKTAEKKLAALADPVQEPVAKVDLMTTGGNAGLATRIVEIDDHLRERLRPGQLLYTAPPQRKPLTKEEIQRVYREFMLYQDGLTPSGMQRVTRAIERAHGITP